MLLRILMALVLLLCFSASDRAPANTQLSRDELTKLLVVNADTWQQRELLELVRWQPQSSDHIIVRWIQAHSNELQPLFLFELAERLSRHDQDTAFEWWAVARARVSYDAARCVNEAASKRLGLLGRGDPFHKQDLVRGFERALGRSDLFIDQISPAWICTQGIAPYVHGASLLPGGDMGVKPKKEWPAIKEKIRFEVISFTGRPNASGVQRFLPRFGARTVVWSPDGKLAASEDGSPHHLVTVWDVEKGRERFEGSLVTSGSNSLAFTRDSKELITAQAEADHSVSSGMSVWDVESGSVVGHIDGFGIDRPLIAISPDRAVLAVATGGLITLYETDHWTRRRSLTFPASVNSLALSSDGSRLAAGGSIGMWLYDVGAGAAPWKAEPSRALAFSPDGRRIAVGERVGSYKKGPDGQDHEEVRILIFNSADGTVVRRLGPHLLDLMNGITWSADGRHLVSASQDGTVRLWDVEGDSRLKTILTFGEGALYGGASAVALSPDGTRLAAAGDEYVVILDLERAGSMVEAQGTLSPVCIVCN